MSKWRIEMSDAVQDNILDRMVPSDLRLLIGERDRAEAEAQALREEVTALRARVVVIPDPMSTATARFDWDLEGMDGWNACLDELARLNGKVVSEGLLRDIYLAGWQASGEGWNEEYPGDAHNRQEWKDNRDAAIKFLLGEGKEVGDGL